MLLRELATAPFFAPEIPEEKVTKRDNRGKRALKSLNLFTERSLHTAEVG
jgi:hypothetical protein